MLLLDLAAKAHIEVQESSGLRRLIARAPGDDDDDRAITTDIKTGLQNSGKMGCRGLLNGRMGMHECSLATYLDLYAAHERLLVIADALQAQDAPPKEGS